MTAHFEVFEDKAGEWRWRLVAANGEPVAASEAYTTQAHAEHGVVNVTRAVLGTLEETHIRPRIERKKTETQSH